MYTDVESILVLFVGFQEERSKTREGCVGNRCRLRRLDCMGDWYGNEEGVRWWHGRRILGMD